MAPSRIQAVFITGILLVCAGCVIPWIAKRPVEEIAADAAVAVTQKLEACEKAAHDAAGSVTNNSEIPEALFAESRMGLYLTRGDSLVYWNNARIPIKSTVSGFSERWGIARLTDGYYLFAKEPINDGYALALLRVKPDYRVQNNYLENDFARWTGIPRDVELAKPGSGIADVVVRNTPLFSLKSHSAWHYNDRADNAGIILFFIGFVTVLLTLLIMMTRRSRYKWTGIAVAILLSLRVVFYFTGWPAFFQRTPLFDLRIFADASSWVNPTLGDLLINSLLALFIAGMLHYNRKKLWQPFITGAMVAVLSTVITVTVKSLVSNSTLSFDLQNIFNVALPAWIGLATLSFFSLALFVVITDLYYATASQNRVYLFFVAGVVAALAIVFTGTMTPAEWFWPIILSIVVFAVNHRRRVGTALSLGVMVLIVSAFCAAMLSRHVAINREKDIGVLTLRLSERQDPVLESEYAQLPARIQRDRSIENLLSILPATGEALQDLLSQKYFSEYFSRYHVEYALFDEKCLPLFDTKQPLLLNEGYFSDQIGYHADSTSVEGLWFFADYQPSGRYIGRMPLGKLRLYVVMEPKQMGEAGTFPDLLLDKSQQRHEKLKNLNYAIYRQNQLNAEFGKIDYPRVLPDSTLLAQSNDEYAHRYFSPDEFTTIVTSVPARSASVFFTYNSYLLLLFSLISYGVWLAYALLFTRYFQRASLSRRIQTMILLLIIVSIAAVGYVSGRLVIKQFETANRDELNEKSAVIVEELDAQFRKNTLFDPTNADAVHLKMSNYAKLFNTDITLFNEKGHLVTSSQPRLYSLGLAAPLANPLALRALKSNIASAITVNEKAGALSYLSHYAPVYGSNNVIAGYVNLPYFARQNDLVNELSGIVGGLVNIYVILFLVSMGAGLVLAGYITQPLRMIQEQFSRISLGGRNEKIRWQSTDEVGRLVEAYNEMLVKLEASANLLAKSERESAWREMARQVAHEIKNPLTPMKLNLQHLQQLAKTDRDQFNERFVRASAVIVEQIDALATIASEFSHFAQLPATQLTEVNLVEVIDTAVQTYAGTSGVNIRFNISEKLIVVQADREQCLRVFNNLLSNAIQAVAESDTPAITIGREFRDGKVIVSVTDNGCGISSELKNSIFTPSFTTKSTGSGLGLAMVKSIIEGFNGKVWFVSEEKKGTTFFTEFSLS